jgi:hypothetical protein
MSDQSDDSLESFGHINATAITDRHCPFCGHKQIQVFGVTRWRMLNVRCINCQCSVLAQPDKSGNLTFETAVRTWESRIDDTDEFKELQKKKQEFKELLDSVRFLDHRSRTEEQQNQMDALVRWFAERDDAGRFIGLEGPA